MLDSNVIVGFDTETTGIDPHSARVVTCSCIRQENGEMTELYWILDPEVEIPEGASDVHGVTTEIARRDGQNYLSGMESIASVLRYSIERGEPLLAYNGSYDITLIRCEIERLGIDFPSELWDNMILLDPYVMDCAVDQYRKGGHTLGAVAKLYGYDLENAHNASADVLATFHVLENLSPKFLNKIVEDFDKEAETYDDLMKIQKYYYKMYKTSLERYFRKSKDKNMVINKEWPFADKEN